MRSRGDEELRTLGEWCIVVLEYMADIDQASDVYSQVAEATRATIERRNLRGLRSIARDVREWTTALSTDHYQRLDRVLRQRFGRGLTEESEQLRLAVQRILRRGRINSEEEADALRRRIDLIQSDEANQDELRKISNLLSRFEMRGR